MHVRPEPALGLAMPGPGRGPQRATPKNVTTSTNIQCVNILFRSQRTQKKMHHEPASKTWSHVDARSTWQTCSSKQKQGWGPSTRPIKERTWHATIKNSDLFKSIIKMTVKSCASMTHSNSKGVAGTLTVPGMGVQDVSEDRRKTYLLHSRKMHIGARTPDPRKMYMGSNNE